MVRDTVNHEKIGYLLCRKALVVPGAPVVAHTLVGLQEKSFCLVHIQLARRRDDHKIRFVS